jgi:hypothetical protein
MNWSSSGFLGVLAANKQHWFLAWEWLQSAKTFGQLQCQEGMTCPKSATQRLLSMVKSLIGPIYGGNELWSSSVFLGVLPANKQHWFLAWLWLKSTKTFGQRQCQEGTSCPKSATQSLHSMVTCKITHWTHMEEMKWSSSVSLVCWLQTNRIGFWLGSG